MLRRRIAVGLALAVVVVLSPGGKVAAQVPVPFEGTLEGRHVSRTPVAPPVVFDVFEAAGSATHLGKHQLVIEAQVDFGTLPPTAVGEFTFTASDGDELAADFTGSSALVMPGLVLITEHATIDPDRSTGRFAGATGKFVVKRLADSATGVNGVTTGAFEGTIQFAPRR